MAIKIRVTLTPDYVAEILSGGKIKKMYNPWETIEYIRNSRPLSVEVNNRGLTLAQSLDKHLPKMKIVVVSDRAMDKEFSKREEE